MQSAETKLNKNSLLLALRRYSAAVHNMEQTILLPSLLREVPPDDALDCDAAEDASDLYQSYLLLKAIRNTIDCGLIPADDGKAKKNAALNKSLEPLLEEDAEVLFHFHLRGLFSVIGNLTKKSQNVTEKYLDIIGISK
ncbi:thyroid hormone-inducible hepatic protein [Chanos chanos]|uniref:Thyroid hormone-inducible hepatic protein n=1 Tax=Chanos chanos TaxID=29144 RepID=A0A6J2VJZ7_CHACN|nr:thyroid hormone-inducible hepatic protein [Chanos chanos]